MGSAFGAAKPAAEPVRFQARTERSCWTYSRVATVTRSVWEALRYAAFGSALPRRAPGGNGVYADAADRAAVAERGDARAARHPRPTGDGRSEIGQPGP